jgi:hypothetical protein
MRVAAQLDRGDSGGMDGKGELRPQCLDRTAPIACRAGPLVGALTQALITLADIEQENGRIMSGRYLYN